MYIYFSSCNVFENGCIYIYIHTYIVLVIYRLTSDKTNGDRLFTELGVEFSLR